MNRQKHKLSRRILAMLLTAAMLVTMFPAAMFATPTAEAGSEGVPQLDVSKSKTATNLEQNENGDWQSDVTLSLPSEEYSQKMDVVFVIDDTSAGSGIFEESVTQLLTELAETENLDINVGIVAFDAVARDWLAATSDYEGMVSVKDADAFQALKTAVSTTLAYENSGYTQKIGATNTEWPIDMATEMLNSGRADAEKYLLVFSDMYGYVYRGQMTINDQVFDNVPVGVRHQGYNQAQLAIAAPKYDTWSDLYSHKDEKDTTMDSFFRDSSWDAYWSIYQNMGDNIPELVEGESPVWGEAYFTPFEKSTCLTYDAILRTVAQGIQVTVINNDFASEYPAIQTIKNGMLDDLAQNHGVQLIRETAEHGQEFTSDQMTEIFANLSDELIQVVGAGSEVVDVIGNDFDFVNTADTPPTLTVDGELLTATPLVDDSAPGADLAWSFGDETTQNRFELYYYKEGTTYDEKSVGECFVWKTNEDITKDATVQLTYTVQLTDPKTEPGTYGEYDKNGDGYLNENDGTETGTEATGVGLFTNESATIYPVDSNEQKGTPEEFPRPTVSYEIAQQQSITITPANITIYMGGNDGYEAVVGEDSTVPATSVNSLPSPLFLIESGIDGFDPTQLVFTNKANEDKGWTAKRVGAVSNEPNAHGLYRLVPTGENQDAVRVQYTDGDTAVVSDEFDPTIQQELYKQYGIEMYYGSNNPEDIVATYDGTTYGIKMETGTLTVRAVDNTENTPETNPVHRITTGTTGESVALDDDVPAAITAPEGTTYTLNETTVPVEAAGVGLLFDGIINDDAHQRTAALIDKVDATMGGDSSNRKYRAQYLDLVDENNGNVWVKASGDVTITWAYPEDTGENTEFTLYHFEGLHRDGTNSGFEISDVNGITPEKIDIDTDENGITFTVGSGGFSPFVLVWEEADDDDNPPYIPPTTGDDDDDEEEPDTPALDKVNHFLYVEGYPEDYRTGEYSDNEDLWPVKPQGNITRAEVATIFYRLLKDEVREEIETDVNSFPDVNEDDWFNVTVSSLANMGAISGYEDGTFRPNEPISRAELAAMAVRFYDTFEAEYEEGTFLDVDGDEWYADAIAAAEELGIIGGYPDGTVRPEANITRAETCAIVNRVLERRPHDDHLGDADDMRTWPDNQPGAWYYADMQEATNGHYYEWIDIDGSKFEEWTEVDKDYDWTKR